MILDKGVANMKDVRIQYWDTTQATWYRGAIRGMWQEKPRSHWLVRFDDDTEYAVSKTEDAWKLVRETPTICFYFSGQSCALSELTTVLDVWRVFRTLQWSI